MRIAHKSLRRCRGGAVAPQWRCGGGAVAVQWRAAAAVEAAASHRARAVLHKVSPGESDPEFAVVAAKDLSYRQDRVQFVPW